MLINGVYGARFPKLGSCRDNSGEPVNFVGRKLCLYLYQFLTECQHTIFLLAVPVTVSPIHIEDIFTSHYNCCQYPKRPFIFITVSKLWWLLGLLLDLVICWVNKEAHILMSKWYLYYSANSISTKLVLIIILCVLLYALKTWLCNTICF